MPTRLLALLLALLACSATALEAPQVVVLVTLDTTRADHLGCYGYPRPTTPFIDSLAREGVLFETAYSAISHTAPSHATIFTGLYPYQHSIRANGDAFPEGDSAENLGFSTLAERFSAAGYRTAAFTATAFLAPIARGFEYLNRGGGQRGFAYRPAADSVDQVIDWLRLRRHDERLFIWLHLFDPHQPQRAPESDTRALAFRDPAAARAFGLATEQRRGIAPSLFGTPEELARVYAAYDAELHYADRELRRLHAALRERGALRDAWWIVTGDHGEGMGQHGHREHGRFVYEEQLHVPLVFWGRGLAAGRRVSGIAHLTDLWPTLATLLGAELRQPAHRLPGISLLDALAGARLPARQVFAERRPRDEERISWEPEEPFAIFDQDWKYIAKSEGEDELYDRRSDPLELRNLIARPSPVRERLETAARSAWARLRAEGSRYSGPRRSLDAAEQEELRALGYLN
jgi:arylsulfatase A-like enzyme